MLRNRLLFNLSNSRYQLPILQPTFHLPSLQPTFHLPILQPTVHLPNLQSSSSLSSTTVPGYLLPGNLNCSSAVRFSTATANTAAATADTDALSTQIDVSIVDGLPQIIVPLPSRNEKCVFSLKPVLNNVGDFIEMLKFEDRGIDTIFIKNSDGIRIAAKTSIQRLFDQEFELHINDTVHRVVPPKLATLSSDELKKISDVKFLISELYEALNIQDFHVEKEAQLIKDLETMKNELKPLEDQKLELQDWAERRTSFFTWVGLGMMSVQFGVLARLTWWEYSWDIMEPVTYFVTYGTAIIAYSYFVLTKQEYLYNDVAKRTWLMSFHKKADKHRWDVNKYNSLKKGIMNAEADLRRLRAPIQTLKRNPVLGQDGKSSGIFGIQNLKDVLNKLQ